MPKTKTTKKKLSLSTLIFTALLLGALFGVGLHYLVPAGHIRDDIIIEGALYVFVPIPLRSSLPDSIL